MAHDQETEPGTSKVPAARPPQGEDTPARSGARPTGKTGRSAASAGVRKGGARTSGAPRAGMAPVESESGDTRHWLIPDTEASFVLGFMLAALRRDGVAWLGKARAERLGRALGVSEEDALKVLDRKPSPPAELGNPTVWFGRRVPIQHGKRMVWLELFWRPDQKLWPRGWGSFAVRLRLENTGTIEIRGRVEENRLDAVMYVEKISRVLAADTADYFKKIIGLMGFEGGLSVRTADNPPERH